MPQKSSEDFIATRDLNMYGFVIILSTACCLRMISGATDYKVSSFSCQSLEESSVHVKYCGSDGRKVAVYINVTRPMDKILVSKDFLLESLH